jgi:NAD(P)-dependent dehydrogenase (short-subunit alcohol dehydrogenase family)
MNSVLQKDKLMKIGGLTALVTGGSSGLGGACVRHLAKAGAKVVIADLNQEAGEKLAAELGPNVRFAKTDVTDETSAKAAVNAAVQNFGGLHLSIQCAGIVVAERILGKTAPHPLGSFSKVVAVNLIGTFNVMRLAAEAMARNEPNAAGERGVIVNTASIAAFEGQIGQIAYAASKGGVAAMTLPAARELARQGIRVMTVAPGTFDTPLLAGLPEAARISLGQQVPFPSRLGRPEEFAALVGHIIENEMLNGEVIRLDGALRMGPK